MLEIYNEGEISGEKKDPSSVVQMMKCSTKESGDKLFRLNEYLRKEQIAAFFSRLTYQRWKGNTLVEDIVNTSDDDEVDSTEENTTECGDESDKKEKGSKTKKKDLGRKKTVKVTAVMRKRKMKMTANSMKICFVPLKKM